MVATRDVLAKLDARVGAPNRRVPPPAWEPQHGPVRRAGLTGVERIGAVALAGVLILGGMVSLASGSSLPAIVFVGPIIGIPVGFAVALVPSVRRRAGPGPVLMLLPPEVAVVDGPPVSPTSAGAVLAVLAASVFALATDSGPTMAFYGVLLLLIPQVQRHQLSEIGRKAGGTVMVLADTRKARTLSGSRLYVLRQASGPTSTSGSVPSVAAGPIPHPRARPPYGDLSR